MSFVDAIKSVLSQYVTFSGRARRSEYWFWLLAVCLGSIVTTLLDQAMGTRPGQTGIFTTILSLAIFLPTLAVGIRRLHDTSRSGWWVLIGLVPFIGSIVLLVFMVQDSHGENRWGYPPKKVAARPAWN